MDNLQYFIVKETKEPITYRFKPYYKWITFNTKEANELKERMIRVLNLIING